MKEWSLERFLTVGTLIVQLGLGVAYANSLGEKVENITMKLDLLTAKAEANQIQSVRLLAREEDTLRRLSEIERRIESR